MGQTVHGFADDQEEQQGISVSETFKALKTKEQFQQKISELASELSKRMSDR